MQPRSELLIQESSGGYTQKPSFSERGGTALAVGDSRRVRLIGTTLKRSAHASTQGTLMSQRALYPPPQAVPLLPHGRRLGKVQPRRELLMKEGSG